jgi:DNA-directed RNA polymerase I, II, and III subunit RPABC2
MLDDYEGASEPEVFEEAVEDPDAAIDDNPDYDALVYTGDEAAAAAAEEQRKKAKKGGRNTVEEEKSKKIDNDKRTTTPYMTKYERARVLGTRALQIR